MTTLPRPYQLLAELVDHLELIDDGEVIRGVRRARTVVQELAIELWRAGQTEKRAMDTYEYDPPLWCGGMFVDDVTRAVGVPTVAASDPSKDLGRGRTIR